MLSKEEVKSCYSKFSRPMLDAPITVRIKFCKVGNLQFISHLDLQRSFHRILVRSGIPMWYTKGFNPHAKLVFGLPLSVGTESMCEFADLKIEREITLDEIKDQLNANLTDEMYVLEAYIPSRKFLEISYARYSITIKSDHLPDNSLAQIAKLFFVSTPIMMTKRSKSGEKEVDIKSYIKDIAANTDGNTLEINAVLAAGNTESLNPEYLVTAIKQNTDIFSDAQNISYRIMRTDVYDANMQQFR
ncbi:MAG: DUF2344 domain-containing protein [Ruminococcaceae bacterium]|nr:DUF2344 domain-containing protein [Oscillospiraceae bacterium]